MTRIPFNIFPVGPDKAPLVAGWQDKATRDGYTISQWEAHGAVAWGIPCGEVNGLFVIDLDVDKATGEPMGEASLKALPRYAGLLDHAHMGGWFVNNVRLTHERLHAFPRGVQNPPRWRRHVRNSSRQVASERIMPKTSVA